MTKSAEKETVKVLVVEDDLAHAELLISLNESFGHFVRHVTSMQDAIESVEVWRPELVILDLFLEDWNGLVLLNQIRSQPEYDNVVVICISASENNEIVVKALESGANDFLKKPYRIAELTIRISALLELKHTSEKLAESRRKLHLQRDKLGKYFSSGFRKAILNGDIPSKVGGTIRPVTSLMVNVREAPALASKLPAKEFADLLNSLYYDLTDIVYGNNGAINKFHGKGFLATFGAVKPTEEDASNALNVAIGVRKHVGFYNKLDASGLGKHIHVDMGIAFGNVFAGSIGSAHRLDYTVLGDAVNLSARLASLCEAIDTDILITHDTIEQLTSLVEFEPVQLESIRGKLQEVKVYKVPHE